MAFDRPAAFREHVEAQLDYVWSTLVRLGIPPGDAEDVLHDVLLEIHAKLDQWDTARPIRPWLFGFAYRAASQHRRKIKRRKESAMELDVPSNETAVDQKLEGAERADMLRRVLDELDEDKRAVLVAYELDELPMKEVADALGIPLNTAYSRLRLAREDLGRRLRQKGLSEVPS